MSPQLPCDETGTCMLCKTKTSETDNLICTTCHTPWHLTCLVTKPETLADTLRWDCPDCDGVSSPVGAVTGGESSELVAAVRAIEADGDLNEREKAEKRQELFGGKIEREKEKEKDSGKTMIKKTGGVLSAVVDSLTCAICLNLPERPVTTPCGHNFCLKCFQKWIHQGKRTCATCRSGIPSKMANQPRINSALVVAIRTAKMSKSNDHIDPDKVQYFVHNQDRPDTAYMTERAKRGGKSNAASGKIFVTTPHDHMGPILAVNDPERDRGVLVGDWWLHRLDCKQWGVHHPPVAGIAGQSKYGAQSVVLSGGYQDDEDHGEWFLYTGSGGRDLSGNKRTNKDQSSDQEFTASNQALRLSCEKGYPIRVVRSHKEKRSSYVPEEGLRYDGIYRIEKCWRKVGQQGFKVCRYLFVRCDNAPAPWTSDLDGDKVRALPAISELKHAVDVTERRESPSWDYDEQEGRWEWIKPPPPSKDRVSTSRPVDGEEKIEIRRKVQKKNSVDLQKQILKGFGCLHCKNVMTLPVTTPCGHTFCKSCLEGVFAGQTFERKRTCIGGRSLRSQKNEMKCPSCPSDISEFLKNPQVNRELESIIEALRAEVDNHEAQADEVEKEDTTEGSGKETSDSGDDKSQENADPNLEATNNLKRKRNLPTLNEDDAEVEYAGSTEEVAVEKGGLQ